MKGSEIVVGEIIDMPKRQQHRGDDQVDDDERHVDDEADLEGARELAERDRSANAQALGQMLVAESRKNRR